MANEPSSTILKDAYLFLIYGAKKNDRFVLEYTPKQKIDIEAKINLLNQIQHSASSVGDIAQRIGMNVYTAPIVQNFVSKQLPSATLGRINSSLYDIMSDGKISVSEVADDFIRSMTGTLDNVAINMGFPTVSTLYNSIKPNGSGILSKDFIKAMSKSSVKEIEEKAEIENNYLATEDGIIKFSLVNKDTEKWNTDVPVRKTESGLFLAPMLGNHNIEKSFSTILVDNKYSMYEVKEQLYRLRDSKESFDIYILDYDVKYAYKMENCVFTDIGVDTYNQNALSVDMSIMQIPQYEVLVDTNLDKGLKSSSGSSGKGKKSTKSNATKTSPKKVKSPTAFQKFTANEKAGSLNNLKDDFNDANRKLQSATNEQDKAKFRQIKKNCVSGAKNIFKSYHGLDVSEADIEKAFYQNWNFKQN